MCSHMPQRFVAERVKCAKKRQSSLCLFLWVLSGKVLYLTCYLRSSWTQVTFDVREVLICYQDWRRQTENYFFALTSVAECWREKKKKNRIFQPLNKELIWKQSVLQSAVSLNLFSPGTYSTCKVEFLNRSVFGYIIFTSDSVKLLFCCFLHLSGGGGGR